MSVSPELRFIPGVAMTFTRAGLTHEILLDIIKGNKNRDLAIDAARLLNIYKKEMSFNLEGIQNIPEGGLITFNHPNNKILLPSILKIIYEIKAEKNKNVYLVAASEVMLSAKLNDKTSFPGSQAFMKRYHALYPNNIISSPTVPSRSDFLTGRAVVARKILRNLKQGNLVLISPEGHVEENDTISPCNTFHEGSGALARLSAKMNLPVVPVSIWSRDRKQINIKVGMPQLMNSESNTDAVVQIMKNIADMLPHDLRGPFR